MKSSILCFSLFYREKFSKEMGVGKDDHVVLERKSFIDFELGDSGKGEADEEDTSLTEKKQIIDAIGSKNTHTPLRKIGQIRFGF